MPCRNVQLHEHAAAVPLPTNEGSVPFVLLAGMVPAQVARSGALIRPLAAFALSSGAEESA